MTDQQNPFSEIIVKGKDDNLFEYLCILIILLVKCLVTYESVKGTDFSWFYSIDTIIFYFIISLLIIKKKGNIEEYNIDFFTICILLFIQFSTIYSNLLFNILNALITISLFLYVLFNKKSIPKSSLISVTTFFLGIILGISIALFKMYMNNPGFLSLIQNSPIVFLCSIFYSIMFNSMSEEFIFRGLFWGIIQKMKLPDFVIILLTSILWTIYHLSAKNNPYELVNVFIFGIFFGLTVKYTKRINVSIGLHSGYNSVLIFQKMITK